MIWTRKKNVPKKGTFTLLEEKILDSVIENASENLAEKILNQKIVITHFLRLHYKNDSIINIYPKSYDRKDSQTNFDEKGEFVLAKVVFHCDGLKYESKITCVMGRIFEIKILPSIEKTECKQIHINEVIVYENE